MTKKELDSVLNEFERIKERRKNADVFWKSYWEIMSPSYYTMYIEYGELSGFISGISLLNKELGIDLDNWMRYGYVLPGEKQNVNGLCKEFSATDDFEKYLIWKFCKS